jgi:hypothetical protein
LLLLLSKAILQLIGTGAGSLPCFDLPIEVAVDILDLCLQPLHLRQELPLLIGITVAA